MPRYIALRIGFFATRRIPQRKPAFDIVSFVKNRTTPLGLLL